MAFSLDSKVKDILKNPAAAEILDKFCPGASKNPQMKLVGGLTLRKQYKYGRVLLWKYTKPMQPVGDEQKGEAL